MFRLPGSPAAQESPCRGGFEFSPLLTARGCPRAGNAEFLSAGWLRVPPLAKGPGLSPSPGGSGCPRAYGPRSPLAGGSGSPQAQGPEVSRCRGGSGPPRANGSKMPVAGWPGVAPAPGGGEFPLRRWLRVFLGPVAPGFPFAGWLRVLPGPGAREFPFAGWLRTPSGRDLKPPFAGAGSGVSPFASGSGFPLRRLPFPVVEKFLRLPPRAAQEVSASNFKILWLSTSRPQLTLSCPPRRTLLHRILHSPVHRLGGLCTDGYFQPSAGYRPANLISGSLASLT